MLVCYCIVFINWGRESRWLGSFIYLIRAVFVFLMSLVVGRFGTDINATKTPGRVNRI